jgi:hypothetical protein
LTSPLGGAHCSLAILSDQGMKSASTLTGYMWPFAPRSRKGLRRCDLLQRAVAVLLLGGLLLLAPLAFASPVDAGWIAGLYDAADFDDVTTRAQDISALTKVNCVSDSSPDWEVSHTLRVVGIPAPLRDARLPLIFIVTSRSRSGHLPLVIVKAFRALSFLEPSPARFLSQRRFLGSFLLPGFVLAIELDTRARGRLWQVFT